MLVIKIKLACGNWLKVIKMAKSKKTKKRNHKKIIPPLSATDKTIYYGAGILQLIICCAAALIISDKKAEEFFSEDILASSRNATVFLGTAILFYSAILCTYLCTRKKPLFGNKKIDYFDNSRYIKAYPVFDKRFYDKKTTYNFIAKASLLLIVIPLFLSFLCIPGFTGRTDITEKEIIKYNIHNEIVKTEPIERIKSYSLNSTKSSPVYRSYSDYNIEFELTTYNGENYVFIASEFRDFEAMKELDNLLSGKPKTIVNDSWLNIFIKRNCKTEHDKQIVLDLFDKN